MEKEVIFVKRTSYKRRDRNNSKKRTNRSVRKTNKDTNNIWSDRLVSIGLVLNLIDLPEKIYKFITFIINLF